MAGVLQRFERRLENAVTGAFTRVFRSAVQPVEIAAALQREIDNNANVLSRDRTLVPNDFIVELSGHDYQRLTQFGDTLANELGTLIRDHIKEQRYTAAGDISIDFVKDDSLHTGRFHVVSRASAHVTPVAGQAMTDTAIRRASVLLDIAGLKHPVSTPRLVIGRGSTADLKIDDPGISRSHAEIRVDGASVSIRDLGSTNGISVDGRRVPEAPLANGSSIRLGNTTINVSIVEEVQ